MSFRAYLGAINTKTGKSPGEFAKLDAAGREPLRSFNGRCGADSPLSPTQQRNEPPYHWLDQ